MLSSYSYGAMDEEAYESYLQAGKIAKDVKRKLISVIRPGMDALTISTWVEEEIRRSGANPAFPCNVDIDAVAAHYTPTDSDNVVLNEGSIVKIDLGVELNGFIVDTAISLPLGNADVQLILATEEALKAAVRHARANVKVSEIGAVVQAVIVKHGFKPIRNLSGHEIRRYSLHSGVSIPNVPSTSSERLALDGVYAIEPFATLADGSGLVVNSQIVNIFQLVGDPARRKLTTEELELVKRIKEVSRSLPYTLRWIGKGYEELHARLYKRGIVMGYPVLVEKNGRPVAQAEHTVIVREDGCEVLT